MTNPLPEGLRPLNPAEMLREAILPAVGRSKTEIARLLCISRQTLYDIVGEKQPVTAAMALLLARMFGGSVESWIIMQRDHDLKIVERVLGAALDAMPWVEPAWAIRPATTTP